MNKTIIFALSFTLLFGLAACGKRSAVADGDSSASKKAEPVSDITRPPQVVRSQGKDEEDVESNPEETISFDEWRKQQAATDDDQ